MAAFKSELQLNKCLELWATYTELQHLPMCFEGPANHGTIILNNFLNRECEVQDGRLQAI